MEEKVKPNLILKTRENQNYFSEKKSCIAFMCTHPLLWNSFIALLHTVFPQFI